MKKLHGIALFQNYEKLKKNYALIGVVCGGKRILLSTVGLQDSRKNGGESRQRSRMQLVNMSAHRRECRRNLFNAPCNRGKTIRIMVESK